MDQHISDLVPIAEPIQNTSQVMRKKGRDDQKKKFDFSKKEQRDREAANEEKEHGEESVNITELPLDREVILDIVTRINAYFHKVHRPVTVSLIDHQGKMSIEINDHSSGRKLVKEITDWRDCSVGTVCDWLIKLERGAGLLVDRSA
ncbi:MAG: hypothetical protein HQK57_15125 [Deltaproteobacteria bacterium]|nr:hypothetical protein [Deltaproteobacteria bacterium]